MVGFLTQPKKQRVMRRPRHNFNLVTRPFQIQPFFLAPVLPGETMEALLLQARAVSDPLASPLIGWWKEYYFYYVKHRDLADRDDLTAMMLDPEYDLSGLQTAADAKYYHAASGINWAKLCLQRVVEEDFRNEGEAWDVATLDGMPLASINTDSWTNSLISGDYYETNDIDVDLDADSTITASEIARATRMWQLQVAANLTDQTYEDFLRTYGVSVPQAEEIHRPELVRYVRDWTYPTNTVDPTTGTPSSAASWSIAERADKSRFFKEPGFLFGVTVARPKVYLRDLDGSAADFMIGAMKWLPAIMMDDPYTSMCFQADGSGPAASVLTDNGGYWWDIKDLFLYGDQFYNYAANTGSTPADRNFVTLPHADLSRRFIDSDDADRFFSGTNKTFREDGVVNLQVKSVLIDTTPGNTLPGVTADA